MRIMRKVFGFIIENIFTLGVLGFSIYIILVNRINKYESNTLLIWIISLVGLLSISLFIERITKLNRIESLAKHAFITPSFDLFFKRRRTQPSIEERLDNSGEILISGGSFIRMTNEYLGYFRTKANEKAKLKFMLVNPNSDAADLLATNVIYEFNDIEKYRNQIQNSLDSLKIIRDEYPEQITIKLSNQVPPFGLMITDPKKRTGNMTVEIFGCALPARDRASIYLKKEQEPQAYDYFINQFDSMWNKSSDC
jgi:hypothetical protein